MGRRILSICRGFAALRWSVHTDRIRGDSGRFGQRCGLLPEANRHNFSRVGRHRQRIDLTFRVKCDLYVGRRPAFEGTGQMCGLLGHRRGQFQ